MNVIRQLGDEDDDIVLTIIEASFKELREKERELEDLEALNQILIVSERKSNNELQEARKELINVSFFFFNACTETLKLYCMNI